MSLINYRCAVRRRGFSIATTISKVRGSLTKQVEEAERRFEAGQVGKGELVAHGDPDLSVEKS